MSPSLPCEGDCGAATPHSLVGENPVRRPVWVCDRCETRRVGPFAERDRAADTDRSYTGSVSAIPTDGGEPDA